MSDDLHVPERSARPAVRLLGLLTLSAMLVAVATAPAAAGSPPTRPTSVALSVPETPPSASSRGQDLTPRIPFRSCEPVAAPAAQDGESYSEGGNGRRTTTTTTTGSTTTTTVANYCGDGFCRGSESCSSCPGDCGACQTCGDGFCSGLKENCFTCGADCARCNPIWLGFSTRYINSLNQFGVATSDSGK